MKNIVVDDEVIEHIKRNKRDYRVSTSCDGPVVIPIEMKVPKESDLRIKVGDNTLYISKVQAKYIDRVTADMLDEARYRNCSLF
jgi:hypothetical protein